MKKSRIFKVAAVVLTMALVFAVAGCGKKEEPKKAETNELTGTIQIAGSTSVQPLSEELAKAFMAKNPKVKINVAGGGSSAGVKAAQEGTADIGSASRELKEKEVGTVQELKIALDGIAVVIHKDNKVEDLTMEQIQKIFMGEIKDWSEVGGEKGAIHVFNREEGSGTRGAFEDIVMKKEAFTEKAGIQNSTGAVRTAVAGDKAGIGYISLGSLNEDVKALKVGGVEATIENIKKDTYKVYRPFLYMTQKAPEGATKAYIEWVLSDEGQKVVESKKFISVK